MRDNFDAKVRTKLAERAGYICSNPQCNIITIGPSDTIKNASSKVGKAAHIHAAASGGPRYESNQTAEQRSSIGNALWLCANCADLIDKNNGSDYSASLLHSWKSEHEKMVSQLLKSGSSPLALIRRQTQEGVIAQRILEFLDSKGALFMEPPFEHNPFVIQSLNKIRDRLTDELQHIDVESPLYGRVRAISEQCRKYMNEMSSHSDFTLMEMHLLVTRKAIGIVIKSICDQYGLQSPPNLITIMPR